MDYFAPSGRKVSMLDLQPGDIVELIATRPPSSKTIATVNSVSSDGVPSIMSDRFQRFYEADRTAYLLYRPPPDEPTNVGAMVRVSLPDEEAKYYVRSTRPPRSHPWMSLQGGALIYFNWEDVVNPAHDVEVIYNGYEENK